MGADRRIGADMRPPRRAKFIHATTTRQNAARSACTLSLAFVILLAGCDRGDAPKSSSNRVVVYCSVDEAISRPILEAYGRRAGIVVQVIYDSEAGKTTGLVQRIMAESKGAGSRADVFWSGEIFNTVVLAEMGLLAAYDPPSAADVPARFRDTQKRWTGTAVRARVIAFDPKRTPRDKVPTRWEDLAKGEIAKRTVIANPLFGTTKGHVAAMFSRMGDASGRAWLAALREGGVQLADGNSAAVRALIAGRADFAATDSDDVWLAQKSGASLDLVYPDLGGSGTLLVPCTAAIVQGAPNLENAKALLDHLVSAEVERRLAESDARHIPVRESLRRELKMDWPGETIVDYAAVAREMAASEAAVREILIR